MSKLSELVTRISERFLSDARGSRLGIGLVFGALLTAGVALAEADDAEAASRRALFERAVSSYTEALSETDRDARLADFAAAERGFAALAEQGVETPALWTNLGNAALQAQHPGQAVVAYHRALRINPVDAKARQNLNHVRSSLPSWVPRPQADEDAKTFSLSAVSHENRARIAGFLFLVMAVCAAASVRRSQGIWRGLAILSGMGWLLFLASTLLPESAVEKRLAVTTANESFARSADSTLSALAFPDPLPPGVEAELLEDRAEWKRVRLANGRDVWLKGSSLTVIPAASR